MSTTFVVTSDQRSLIIIFLPVYPDA